jgi:hemolysin III
LISKIREPFNALSHFAGALAAVVGCCLLLFRNEGLPVRAAALAIYGLSLVGLFSASGVYHAAIAGPRILTILRKIDHSAIYLLIAGSYTPFCVLALTGFWQWGLLAIVWCLAAGGITLKVFVINTPRWLTASIYVLMGWLGVAAWSEFQLRLPQAAVAWLVTGGIVYTLGALIYITRKGNFFPGVFGFHELWHLFVLAGAAAHFAAVAAIT